MKNSSNQLMRNEINSCKWLFLRELYVTEENGLRAVVQEAKADGPPEDIEIAGKVISGTIAIESDESCQTFEIVWPNYVAYSVRNESYTTWDDSEKWEGNTFRLYSQSHFLEYVAKATFASDEYPGPLQHWCLVCPLQLLDVVASIEPDMRRLPLG